MKRIYIFRMAMILHPGGYLNKIGIIENFVSSEVVK